MQSDWVAESLGGCSKSSSMYVWHKERSRLKGVLEMIRSKSVAAWALVGMLGLSSTPAAQAMDFAQAMGFGYGPGYNAPVPGGYGYGYGGGGYGPNAPFCSAQRGCCEIPANWRMHVWDGYRGDACTWHTSYCGVPKTPNGSAYGFGSAGCPTCQPGGAQPQPAASYATPVSAQQPMALTPKPLQN